LVQSGWRLLRLLDYQLPAPDSRLECTESGGGMPPSYHFVYEHQFCVELGEIEPRERYQDIICQRVERACGDRIRMGALGYGFACVSWTRDLLTWYQTDGTAVYLLSIRYDLLKSSGTV
jgi:hypothetical protein